ncbi:DUF4136 domain-containing protein [Parasphingopyxis lamellibrachiae]|uniref:Uncharacterized protein DUF4136 n=1 Tax=Parasphingopyxis lamellibrachiae TaxID=680125 RepID=A0A3D9FC66_9SPHN|nr:DUF4136 domain-containing protein [Parasphingopyxis lamellibrachiae]RED15323.1 uncharacterized protein DUF4136 [Parasphingopyxis lamellibrachiae]
MSRRFLALIAPLALLAAAACTTPFRADVARFQQMPAPQGQSFYIQPADDEKSGGLEFATYANLVAAELNQYGYRASGSAEEATLVVTMEYSVDNGRERVVTSPGYRRGYWGHRSLFYSPYYDRFGWRSSYYRGWHDPFFDYPQVRSYTLYTSELDLRIARTADGEPVFEGRARARSRNDALTELVPNLIEAMFTGFPGNSGEEIRITVLPREDG